MSDGAWTALAFATRLDDLKLSSRICTYGLRTGWAVLSPGFATGRGQLLGCCEVSNGASSLRVESFGRHEVLLAVTGECVSSLL